MSTDGSLTDFERVLKIEAAASAEAIYGELDETLTIQPLTENQAIRKSLEALHEYCRTGNSIAHGQVQKWIDSLSTDLESSFP